MINKIIHYCWFSNDPYPGMIQICINSWKKRMPDYNIKLWDMNEINKIDLPDFAKQALERKKYAFACDYVRAYALYKEGGIYLDSDVFINCDNPFSEYENDDFWIPIEDVGYPQDDIKKKVDKDGYNITNQYIFGIGVNPVFMISKPNHPYMKDVMDYYYNTYINLDRALENDTTEAIAPQIYSKVLEKYGFRYVNEEQFLDCGIHVITDDYFKHIGCKKEKEIKVLHLANSSWRKK